MSLYSTLKKRYDVLLIPVHTLREKCEVLRSPVSSDELESAADSHSAAGHFSGTMRVREREREIKRARERDVQ